LLGYLDQSETVHLRDALSTFLSSLRDERWSDAFSLADPSESAVARDHRPDLSYEGGRPDAVPGPGPGSQTQELQQVCKASGLPLRLTFACESFRKQELDLVPRSVPQCVTPVRRLRPS
jgi:hypothetical protein